jgi:predicted DNA-binding ribbon-helix-helix protein
MPSALNKPLPRRVRNMCAGLEGQFFNALIEISRLHKKTFEELLIEIDTQRKRGQKLSTAARLFVLDFYLTETEMPERKTEKIARSHSPAQNFYPEINSFWDSPSLHLRSESLRESERLIELVQEIESFYGKVKH